MLFLRHRFKEVEVKAEKVEIKAHRQLEKELIKTELRRKIW